MKYSFYVLVLVLAACGNPQKQEETDEVKTSNEAADSAPPSQIVEPNLVVPTHSEEDSFHAAIIANYLERNKERFTSPNPDQHTAYMTNITERDGKNYLTVQIGLDDEFRFATMQWLFIDTASHQVYELDVVEDVLVPWP